MLLKAQENLTIVQRPTSSLKPSGRKYKFRNGSIQYIQTHSLVILQQNHIKKEKRKIRDDARCLWKLCGQKLHHSKFWPSLTGCSSPCPSPLALVNYSGGLWCRKYTNCGTKKYLLSVVEINRSVIK